MPFCRVVIKNLDFWRLLCRGQRDSQPRYCMYYSTGAARTPMGGFRGSLSSFSAPQLGAVAVRAALERANCPATAVDEVYLGAVLQSGMGQAVHSNTESWKPHIFGSCKTMC